MGNCAAARQSTDHGWALRRICGGPDLPCSTLERFSMFATPNALRTLFAAGLLSVATLGPALAADDEVTMF